MKLRAGSSNWPVCGADFVKDYKALVESLRSVNPGAQFYIARMTPLGAGHSRLLTGNIPYHRHIQHAIETVARETGAQLIDFYEPLIARPDLLPDSVHPNAEGAGILAKTVYSAITGDFGGLRFGGLGFIDVIHGGSPEGMPEATIPIGA